MPSSSWPAAFVSAIAIGAFAPASSMGSAAALAAPAVNGDATKPKVSVSYAKPARTATVSVTFVGMPPPDVTVSARMAMRGEIHVVSRIALKKTSDPHTLQAILRFSMGGTWTIEVHYDSSREIDVPLKVGG
jgi:hypothetical protein